MKKYSMFVPINKATRKYLISNMTFESNLPPMTDGDYLVVTSTKDGEDSFETVTTETFKKLKKKGGIIMLGALIKK